ncbi:molybdopterin molybdotransferase MoeA [soil metagenome]
MHRTVDEHAAAIAQLVNFDTGAEEVDLDDALGRVTAEPVTSPVDLPLFRNSQMDGYAVRASDLPGELPVVGEIPARPGDPPPLNPGETVKIMTGAVVPEGADTVVPVEVVPVTGGTAVFETTPVGQYVRERGSDLRAGDLLVPVGVRLASRHLAALAATGLASVSVRRRPRIAIVTTGAELIEPGATPAMGEVFDSNGVALAAAIHTAGGVVASRHHVTDEVRALEHTLRHLDADLVITSGGISMGDHEVVRQLLEPLGAIVGHVAMQPGGPQATAVFEGMPVICFPGNPVSTQLSFEVFLAPLLRQHAGLPQAKREQRTLEAAITSVNGKRQFLRGRAQAEGGVAVVGGPG